MVIGGTLGGQNFRINFVLCTVHKTYTVMAVFLNIVYNNHNETIGLTEDSAPYGNYIWR